MAFAARYPGTCATCGDDFANAVQELGGLGGAWHLVVAHSALCLGGAVHVDDADVGCKSLQSPDIALDEQIAYKEGVVKTWEDC